MPGLHAAPPRCYSSAVGPWCPGSRQHGRKCALKDAERHCLWIIFCARQRPSGNKKGRDEYSALVPPSYIPPSLLESLQSLLLFCCGLKTQLFNKSLTSCSPTSSSSHSLCSFCAEIPSTSLLSSRFVPLSLHLLHDGCIVAGI